jgi:hypothetical protein
MNDNYLKKFVPIIVMSAILLFDIIVIIFDVISRNTGTAVFLGIMGVILAYRIVVSLKELKK